MIRKGEILAFVRQNGEITSWDVANEFNLDPKASSMRLLRYHRQGLLYRRKAGDGQNQRIYTLSPRGEERLDYFEYGFFELDLSDDGEEIEIEIEEG